MRNPLSQHSARPHLLALGLTALVALVVLGVLAAGQAEAASPAKGKHAAKGLARVGVRHNVSARRHRARQLRQARQHATVKPVIPAAAAPATEAPAATPTKSSSKGGAPVKTPTTVPSTEPIGGSPSPTATASGDLLFKGSRIRDYLLNQSAPGAVTEVADPAGSGSSVFKMTVANSDVYPVTPTSDPRAQLLSPAIIDPGDEFWWSAKFFLPADFPTSVPGWLTVMEGPYGGPFEGTPPWHLEINGSSLRWQRNNTYNWDIPWQMPVAKNSWVNVVVHERFAADGWVEMWVNGQPVTFFSPGSYNPRREATTSHLAMATRDRSNNGGANFLVIQSYRKAGMFDSLSLYQGPMAIGTTRAAVE